MELAALVKELDPDRLRLVGWLFLGLGVLALGWALVDRARGVTSREGGLDVWPEVIREEADPARFHRTIRVTIFGSIVSFAIALVCLVMTW